MCLTSQVTLKKKNKINGTVQQFKPVPTFPRKVLFTDERLSKQAITMSPLPGALRQLSACHDNHKGKRCDALPAMRKVKKKNLSFQKRKGGWRGGRESAQSPLASSAGGPDDILQRMGGDAESRPRVPIVPQTRCDCEQVTAHPSLVSPPVA